MNNQNTSEEWIIAQSLEAAQIKAHNKYSEKKIGVDYELKQDDDVLDTWFFSGIYPFTILNNRYFPLDILETGKDILFFWVAIMVMLSLALKNTLLFKTVYLHNLVKDKDEKNVKKLMKYY